jgi:hypothetical protein
MNKRKNNNSFKDSKMKLAKKIIWVKLHNNSHLKQIARILFHTTLHIYPQSLIHLDKQVLLPSNKSNYSIMPASG